MDSFALYCLATEVRPVEALRVLGLIEARLIRDPDRPDDQTYKGALLTRLSLQMADAGQSSRFMRTGLAMMDDARPNPLLGPVRRLQMLYARALTLAILPPGAGMVHEACAGMGQLLAHPGFELLDAQRQAAALDARQLLRDRKRSPRG